MPRMTWGVVDPRRGDNRETLFVTRRIDPANQKSARRLQEDAAPDAAR